MQGKLFESMCDGEATTAIGKKSQAKNHPESRLVALSSGIRIQIFFRIHLLFSSDNFEIWFIPQNFASTFFSDQVLGVTSAALTLTSMSLLMMNSSMQVPPA